MTHATLSRRHRLRRWMFPVVLSLPLGAAAQEPGPDPPEQAPAAQAPAAQVPLGPPGTIQGQVFDSLTGAPMRDAWVGAAGTEFQTNTDEKGRFSLQLPAGRYELQVAFDLYQTLTVPAVVVEPDKIVRLPRPLRLRPDQARGPITVNVVREPDRNTAAAQNLVRRDSARVSDVVSAEDIRKSGDSSAAQSAARAVGATVVGDRFVYVRGLGERYANALFNGAPLPSPEPDQQAVPFDIFPASLLANLTIAKSATADIPADFAGGSVQINPREFPTRLTASLSASLGANLGTVARPYLTYPGGRADFLGIDDGTRPAPAGIPPFLRDPQSGTLLSRQQVAGLARGFPNTWVPRELPYGPVDHMLSASIGNQAKWGSRRLGYLFSLSYIGNYQTREEERHVYNLDGGQLRSQVDLSGRVSTYGVQWGGLASLSLVPAENHRLSLSAIFTQDADDQARVLSGYSLERNSPVWTSRLRFVARTLGFVQLGGSHLLPRSARGRLLLGDIDWRVTYARALRSEPDNRETYYIGRSDGSYAFLNSGNSGQRFYADNGEHQVAGGIDYTQRFKQWAGLEARFKLGGLLRYRLRDFSARRYQFYSYGRDAAGGPIDTLPPEQLFSPENISNQNGTGVELRDNTAPSDHYDGRMGVYAAYALLDLPVHSRVRLVVGARFEAARQQVDTLSFNGDPVRAALDNDDVLPSANLVYRVTENMNLRAGLALTVARPEFRELSPFQFTDFFGGETVRGNPGLERTRIVNADLRWEWFLGDADLLAVSAFYKYFDQPIESIIIPGGNLIRSFANAPSAYTAGGELEGRKDLGFLSGALRGLSIGGNLSLIYSRVDLSGTAGVQTSTERPLQGQSPFVVNTFLELDRPRWGTQARVLYNVFGERIDSVGALGLPDKLEQPRHQLDVNITQRLGHGFALRLAGRNLLDSPVHILQGGETVLRYRTGRVLSLSLIYNL